MCESNHPYRRTPSLHHTTAGVQCPTRQCWLAFRRWLPEGNINPHYGHRTRYGKIFRMASEASGLSPSALNAALQAEGIELRGQLPAGSLEILTADAVRFVADLARRFETTRQELLHCRRQRQQEIVEGRMPEFLSETAVIRESDWNVAAIPEDLRDRRTEITGPVERKMIINALNSGAKVFMADFEDANTPTWQNTMEGQANLRDAVARTIEFSQDGGKQYKLNDTIATLLVRPR